ncbi:hypothetical protein GTQ34_07430 [Muricauda sp. JGD-17]|uniref:Abasic site processing protein n=1 Tax=Flagellimonas ochracea TaxID=2696472 RepID=A0A964TCZ9_9FLAO|nr:SOS response-associated peptidase family protein [Allomuricauda ochracea]NAY91743.1 hypothetical protein [Allomuricauda ochracea]
MVYKLSNAVEREQIEKEFGLTFKYPDLYTPDIVINGLQEASLSVLTMENTNQVTFAIWGLLPEGYKEDWYVFQQMTNTLNVTLHDLQTTTWMGNSLQQGRCLAIISGFFTYLLKNGKTYPYYVQLISESPFYVAGVYHRLDDGFLSCGLITTATDDFLKSFHNIGDQVPLIIPESAKDVWLSPQTETNVLQGIIENPPKAKLRANPIAQEFFKKNILYDSILQPVFYEDVPNGGDSNF